MAGTVAGLVRKSVFALGMSAFLFAGTQALAQEEEEPIMMRPNPEEMDSQMMGGDNGTPGDDVSLLPNPSDPVVKTNRVDLNASKRSVVGDPADDEEGGALIASADLLIEDRAPDALDRAALLAEYPGLVILSISPFGLTGPMAGRAATDFTIQAEAGSIGARERSSATRSPAAGPSSARGTPREIHAAAGANTSRP